MQVAPTAELCIAGREIGGPRRSPDGRLVAYVSTWAGRGALFVVPATGGPERLVSTLGPDEPSPQSGYGAAPFEWLPDGSALVYVARDGNLWLQPFPGGRPRRLTDRPPDQPLSAVAVDASGTRLAATVEMSAIVVASLDGTSSTVPAIDADFVVDPVWSPDGRLAWQEWSVPAMPWDDSRIGWWDPGTGQRGSSGGGDAQAQQPRFDALGRLWSVRDDRGWANCWVGDAPARAEDFEHADPTWGPGQRSFAVSPDGSHVVFQRNELGFGRLCVASVATGAVVELGKGVHTQIEWRHTTITAVRSGARTPPALVAYDLPGGERRTLVELAPAGWSAFPLGEPEAVRWRAADGLDVHGRLYRGAGDGRLLCWMHGGPTDQWKVAFLPRVAYWVGRGWNVLVPDFRGSTGHGRAYQQALRGRWGELDTSDVLAGLRTAAERGWGRPERTVLVGGSAGGFTVLHVLAADPRWCAAGVVAYPVTDLAALEATTHRFEAHYNATLLGTGARAEEAYRSRSPLSFADRLTRTPLLITHGDVDPVVGVDQSERLVAAIIAAGGTAELHVYAGEGHGYRQPANQLDEYRRMEAFIARHVA